MSYVQFVNSKNLENSDLKKERDSKIHEVDSSYYEYLRTMKKEDSDDCDYSVAFMTF
ncbi:hypothetical protein [Clostridium oceanicum]|uniref:Uncharacterized protein n=1 Tax=Clostridium oceanicum TaxID=1543 RepID=A0ABP3UFF6_9CLOT